jgi:flagellar biosynthesis/type III secretory pathway protein FliH
MTLVLLHHTHITAAHKGRVVKSSWVPIIKETQDALDQLAAIVADEKASGFAQGKAQGEVEAKRILVQKLAALEQGAADERQALRDRSASLAIEIVRKLAPSLGSASLVPALAKQMASGLVPDSKIKLYVHPDALTETRMHIAPLDMHIEVVADVDANEFLCRIETSQGQIDGSLDVQLDALSQAFAMKNARHEARHE